MIYIAVMFLPAVGVALWVGFLMLGRMIFSEKAKEGRIRKLERRSVAGYKYVGTDPEVTVKVDQW